MKIYYEDDANIEIIQNMSVAIVGYGSQGHAHANNLHESGVDVTVALREGSSSWNKAEEAGLKVSSVSDAVKDADLVMILAPDEFQKDIYESEIQANLKPNAILAFAHGFNIHFEKITLASHYFAKARSLAAESIGDGGDVAINHTNVGALVGPGLPHRIGEKRSANYDVMPASTGTLD